MDRGSLAMGNVTAPGSCQGLSPPNSRCLKTIPCSVLQSIRRFYRSGAGARSLTEVVSAARRRVRLMLYASKHQSRRDLQFHLTWLAIVVGFEAIAITIAATGNGALLRLMWFFGGATAVAIVAWAWMSGWSKGLRVASPPARHARR
jgi:hypothetical protein